jgi:hypothetical protein
MPGGSIRGLGARFVRTHVSVKMIEPAASNRCGEAENFQDKT